jgi:hypothetical protein
LSYDHLSISDCVSARRGSLSRRRLGLRKTAGSHWRGGDETGS